MKKIFLLQLLLGVIIKTNTQQTVQQVISLTSNGVNSTEILMYKQDNSSYYDLAANNAKTCDAHCCRLIKKI